MAKELSLSNKYYQPKLNQNNIYPSFWLVHKKYQLQQKKVIDLGCADGRYLHHFGPASKGLEVSSQGIEIAKSRGYNVENADLNSFIPGSQGKYDVVFSSHVIEHVESPLSFLRRCHQLLPSNGLLILGYPIEFSLVRLFDPYFAHEGHFYSFSRPCIQALLKEAGFELVEFIYDLPTANRFKPIMKLQMLADKIPFWLMHFAANAITVIAKKKAS